MENMEIKVLIFSINGENYAANIMEVERILEYDAPTPLPDSPDFVVGVINYEGSILPVISLSQKFYAKKNVLSNDTKIIVSKQDNHKIGIIVDKVSEVKNINLTDVESPPDIVAGISKRYIQGLIKLKNVIIIFLNLRTILTEDEKKLII